MYKAAKSELSMFWNTWHIDERKTNRHELKTTKTIMIKQIHIKKS